MGVAARKVGVSSSSRDEVLFVALGVALGVVVVAMTMIVVVCAWRQRQQRRLLGIIGLLHSKYFNGDWGTCRPQVSTSEASTDVWSYADCLSKMYGGQYVAGEIILHYTEDVTEIQCLMAT